jgi:hypothetical protein
MMSLLYRDLDVATRLLMLQEMAADACRGAMQPSNWLTAAGKYHWVNLLRNAIEKGDDVSLASEIRRNDFLQLYQTGQRDGHEYQMKVPRTAADTLAEAEFNHYYCRAICRRALERGNGLVEVYRAKGVKTPRSRSQQLVGTLVEARTLLDDLRAHPGGLDTALGLGIPAGPNSGLSVKLPDYGYAVTQSHDCVQRRAQ